MKISALRAVMGALMVAVGVTAVNAPLMKAQAGVWIIEPSICGPGTLNLCGKKILQNCQVSWTLNGNIFNKSGSFEYTTTNCTFGGDLEQYKDNRVFKEAPPAKCSVPSTNTSRPNPLEGDEESPTDGSSSCTEG